MFTSTVGTAVTESKDSNTKCGRQALRSRPLGIVTRATAFALKLMVITSSCTDRERAPLATQSVGAIESIAKEYESKIHLKCQRQGGGWEEESSERLSVMADIIRKPRTDSCDFLEADVAYSQFVCSPVEWLGLSASDDPPCLAGKTIRYRFDILDPDRIEFEAAEGQLSVSERTALNALEEPGAVADSLGVVLERMCDKSVERAHTLSVSDRGVRIGRIGIPFFLTFDSVRIELGDIHEERLELGTSTRRDIELSLESECVGHGGRRVCKLRGVIESLRDGEMIVLKAMLSGEIRAGVSCSDDCRPAIVGGGQVRVRLESSRRP